MMGETALVLATSGVPADAGPAIFGHDPWWMITLKAHGIFVILLLLTIFNVWFERRVVARMQHRVGPSVHGPFGLLQSLADGVKLSLKEEITPKAVDRVVFFAAPIISVAMAFAAFAVIPLGPQVTIFGHQTSLQLTDLPVGVLFVLAAASVGIYGIVLGGWASGSTYPLLGGLRSSAQMISYEVAMGLALVAVFLYAGSMSTSQIVDAQASGAEATIPFLNLDVQLPSWYAIVLFPSFAIYVVAMIGETNRAPFDLPEAEGELVAGYMTEYSSMKYLSFFLAEYVNMVTVSALATTMFLGGWRAPWPLSAWDGANEGWLPLVWFFGKVLLGMFVFIWVRGTLPRMRYDQFMQLGWKWLIPGALIWTMVVATTRVVITDVNRTNFVIIMLIVLGVVFIGMLVADAIAKSRQQREEERAQAEAEAEVFDAFAGGYPVPPMPGQQLPPDLQPQPMAATATATDEEPGTQTDSSTGSSPDSSPEEPRG